MQIVAANRPATTCAPGFVAIASASAIGRPAGIAKLMQAAGTNQLTAEGMNNAKNSKNPRISFCHTMSVVMSPNGLNAPPAFAATTTLIQAGAVNSALPRPTVTTTAPITNAVVRLSSTGDRKNAIAPVVQNTARNDKPRATSHVRSAANTFRSSNVFT